ncbi:MFS transporter [Sphaerisporangium perillae]|uniref:MFS transporter n=1 Tax=Sphaerisporangium perillae TaxID=2935860 RepID=UPI00200FAD94|nr:MFS transporter [Sphaerisporangium perillae]
MQANLPLRLARSAVFTVVCLTLASVAHWFAGGAAPAPQLLLSGGLVVMTITVALAGRERSPATVTGLLLAAQAFLHQLLGPAGTPGLPTHGPGLADLPRGHGLSVSVGMLTAHLTAALLTGWWLSRGEAALWSVVRGIGTYVLHRLAVLCALLRRDMTPRTVPVLFRLAQAAILPVHNRLLQHAVLRRGPPTLPVF